MANSYNDLKDLKLKTENLEYIREMFGLEEKEAITWLDKCQWNFLKTVKAIKSFRENEKKAAKDAKKKSQMPPPPSPKATKAKKAKKRKSEEYQDLDNIQEGGFQADPDIEDDIEGVEEESSPELPKISFTVFSWNIDENPSTRMKRIPEIVRIIKIENPAIIFLQEVVADTYRVLKEELSNYQGMSSIKSPQQALQFFNVTFLREDTVKYIHHEIIDYPTSRMGRNCLMTKASIDDLNLCLMNSHLESLGKAVEGAVEERKKQFELCLSKIKSQPPEFNVIFGGDLNLRVSEVRKLPKGKMPKLKIPPVWFDEIDDIWEFLGASDETKWTLDWGVNKNNKNDCEWDLRTRYDRLYFRPSVPKTLAPKIFALDGTSPLEGSSLYPSDHWAIKSTFHSAKPDPPPKPTKGKPRKKKSTESQPGTSSQSTPN